MELWLVRHGQTFDNIQRTLAGQQGGKLTEIGTKQAVLTGERLRKQNFDFAYCSDLHRTRETFEAIVAQLECRDKIDIKFLPLIREKSAGDLEGHSLDEFKARAQQANKPIREFKPKNGECWIDVYNRAQAFVLLLAEQHLRAQKQPKQALKHKQGEEEAKADQEGQEEEDTAKILQPAAPQQIEKALFKKPIKEEQKQAEKATKKPTSLGQRDQQAQKILPKGVTIAPPQTVVLGVTHGGFVMEFYNVMRFLHENKKPVFANNAKNCSIHIFHIYCRKSGALCTQECKGLKCLDVKTVLENDNSHCE